MRKDHKEEVLEEIKDEIEYIHRAISTIGAEEARALIAKLSKLKTEVEEDKISYGASIKEFERLLT